MTETVDRLKKQLVEIAEAVNSFDSEAVQLKVIDRLLNHLSQINLSEPETIPVVFIDKPEAETPNKPEKKPGLTKIIKKEIQSGFFDIPLTLGAITDSLAEKYQSKFYTYQTSGILLGLIKKGMLIRQTDEATNKYLYLKPPSL